MNLEREHEAFIRANRRFKDMKQWVGARECSQNVFSRYPAYVRKTDTDDKQSTSNIIKGLTQFNLAMQSNTLSFDSYTFSHNLLNNHLKDRSNFELLLNSEIGEIYSNPDTGAVTAVRVIGKREEISIDALILCTGAATPRLLKSTLGVRVPLMPVKSYSFDIPCDYRTALSFDSFSVVWQRSGVARVHGLQDYAGSNTNFDKRRVRNLLNMVAATLDPNGSNVAHQH